MKNLLKEILKEFNNLPLKKQNIIMREYIDYVENFRNEHEEMDYPVCFLEWYSNDYPELHQN